MTSPDDLRHLSLDAALLWLRSRVYDEDRKAVASLLLARPDLAATGAFTDYIWSHIGNLLLAPLEAGQPTSNIDATILEHLPPAREALQRLADAASHDVALQANQILASLQSRLDPLHRHRDEEDLDDLFGPADDELDDDEDGEPAERGPQRLPLKLRLVEGSADILELAGGSASLVALLDNDGANRLQLNATLMNLIQPAVELNELQLVLRDAEGRLLDVTSHYVNTRFQRAQEVVAELHMEPGSIAAAAQVELNATCSWEFRSRLLQADLHLETPPTEGQRVRWIHAREESAPASGAPPIQAEVEGYLLMRYEPQSYFILRLTELASSIDSSRELALALRDASGRVITRQNAWANLPTAAPTTLKVAVYANEPASLLRAARLDLGVKGFRRCVTRLARFDIIH